MIDAFKTFGIAILGCKYTNPASVVRKAVGQRAGKNTGTGSYGRILIVDDEDIQLNQISTKRKAASFPNYDTAACMTPQAPICE